MDFHRVHPVEKNFHLICSKKHGHNNKIEMSLRFGPSKIFFIVWIKKGFKIKRKRDITVFAIPFFWGREKFSDLIPYIVLRNCQLSCTEITKGAPCSQFFWKLKRDFVNDWSEAEFSNQSSFHFY